MKPRQSFKLTAHSLIAGAAVCLLTHCAAPIAVRTVKPPATGALVSKKSGQAELLDEIRSASTRIARGDESAIPAYNHLVARLVEELEKTGADPWNSTMALETPGGIRGLVGRAPEGARPSESRLVPADTLEFRGTFAEHRATVAGIGAPLVAFTSLEGIGHIEARKKLHLRNLTALVLFDGDLATLELVDPYQTETVRLGGYRLPLAADYGAAVMFGLSKSRIDKLGLARLLKPAQFDDTANLNFLQPYDPARIPVLFVHGLDSTPATFAPMYFALLDDAEIRRRCQFWAFSYPSGYPYPYSASLLRRELDEVAEAFPDRRDIVIAGHSMGSMISRLMVTDAGEKLWQKAFGRTVAETKAKGQSHEILQKCLVFENRPEIRRAVFISGPHRGSELADNWIGRIASKLVRLPWTLADARDTLVSTATGDTAAQRLNRVPNSIDTLSPGNRFVVEVAKLPIAPGIAYHSIIGDRGKGDTPDSSDGVVAYWSSHLEGAASERIVPSGHNAQQHPEGIEEVRRILLVHLRGAR